MNAEGSFKQCDQRKHLEGGGILISWVSMRKDKGRETSLEGDVTSM